MFRNPIQLADHEDNCMNQKPIGVKCAIHLTRMKTIYEKRNESCQLDRIARLSDESCNYRAIIV